MKNIFLLLLLFSSIVACAQENDLSLPPYKRFPTLPPMQLLLGDSTTKFTKENITPGKPVLIMLFSPDCDHCQHETEELVNRKNDIKDIQLVMATTFPLYRMNQFVQDYKVREIDNVIIGKDMYYLLLPFYDVRNFPYLALYDEKGNLITATEGSLPVDKILKLFKK